jgi:hypothetical protein
LVAGLEDSTAIAESVRSRRQFIKKAALGAASLAGIGILGRLPVAAASSSAKPQSSTLLTQRVLQPNDDVLTAAFASKEVSTVVAKHGRSSFGEFTHATYTNNVEAVTAALQPSVGPARMVFAYFRNQQPTEFKVLQLEVVPDLGTNPAQSFSGSARFLAHDESVITSAVFHNGALVSSTFGGGSTYAGGGAVPYAEDWNCVHYCIHNLWWMLPWWVTWACGNVCGACMFINPWGCYLCTGCLGGYAARCLVDCWY